MPELPDLTVYVESIARRVVGLPLRRATLTHPFLLRTVDPPLEALVGERVAEVRRVGKRIALGFESRRWLAMHLMIAGRLHWVDGASKRRGGQAMLTLAFDTGRLTLTEAGVKRRAALHVLADTRALSALDRGGIEPLEASPAAFAAALRQGNHTLKRALTDPRIFAGIGNAYSDEILHAARLSPVALTSRLDDAAIARLQRAVREILAGWTERLRSEAGDTFPEHVTAFWPAFAVHGRYREPCPDCSTAVQRIRYAENETNYCPRCQTGGRLLADRALSRLLKADWPRTIEELDEGQTRRSSSAARRPARR